MSSTRSPKKRAAKANTRLVDRLCRIEARPIDPKLLKVIVGSKPLSAKEATVIEKQIRDLVSEVRRVEQMRRDLAQVPSLVRSGSVLL